MNKSWVSTLIKYSVAVIVAIGLSFGVMGIKGLFSMTEKADIYNALCDAFCVPGLLYILFGILMWVAGMGAFDGIGYTLSYLFSRLLPHGKKTETYHDYKQRKSEKKKGSITFLFIIGAVFLIIGIIFLVLFYQNYSI